MAFPHRNLSLEMPDFLQDQGMLFHFVLIANDVAGVRSWYPQKLLLYIRDQLATVDLGQGNFQCLFVLYFVIFALSRDTPAAQAGDFRVGIKRSRHHAVLASAWAQDLVGHTHYLLNFVGR